MESNLCLQNVFAVAILAVYCAGAVQLTQETPCFLNQPCLLRCDLQSTSRRFNYWVTSGRTNVASCATPQPCQSIFPSLYNLTVVSDSLSYLEILRFTDTDEDTWTCSDGDTGPQASIQLSRNTVPAGPLSFGRTPCREVSPAPLTCSLASPGSPPALLTLANSGGQTVASSQTGSVTGTVTRGGQASCSVTWSAFPSHSLAIPPIQCAVQVPARAVMTSDPPGPSVEVRCEAQGGFPVASQFGAWTQVWGSRQVRAVPARPQDNLASLALTSFQDTGTYTCSVSNGVSGFHSSNLSVQVEDVPQLLLTSALAVQAAEVNQSVVLSCPLYSVPDVTNHTWSLNSLPIISGTGSSVGFQSELSPATVSLAVHGTTVSAPGHNASLALRFQKSHAGNYSLQACNRLGCRSVVIRLQEIVKGSGGGSSIAGLTPSLVTGILLPLVYTVWGLFV